MILFEFETGIIKSRLCDYCDAYILVARDIAINAGSNTNVARKIEHHFQHAKQRSMTFLSMKLIISLSQYLCTI